MISVKWAVACAERCLHFFEEARPNDNRPRKAIEAAKQWIIDPTINIADADAAADAADAVVNNAYAVNAAVYYAAYSASAAADAAHYTDAHYANAAANAAYASSTSTSAANANAANAAIVEQKWSRNKLKEIVGEYINDYKKDLKNILIVRVNIIPELSDIIIKYVV